jgi:hypothetical protein
MKPQISAAAAKARVLAEPAAGVLAPNPHGILSFAVSRMPRVL